MSAHAIAMVCNEYPPAAHGGIGTFTQVLGRELVRRGWRVHVVGLYRGISGPRRESDHGVQVARLPVPGRDFGGIRARHRLYRAVAELIRAGQVELVEIPDAEGWAAGWPRLPVPVVARVHGSCTYFARELGRKLRRVEYLLERAALRRADFWCSVSAYAAERTRHAFRLGPAGAISFVPVELPEIEAQARARRTVLFSGTLTPKKGIVQLIRAWPAVLAEVPDAELHVYGKGGSGPQGWTPERLSGILPAELRASVRFLGHRARPELLAALGAARVAVFPSYAEAFAFAPVEAMAQGCPTIYSRRASGPELIEDGRTGVLIDPDDPAGIANAIVRLLLDAGFAQRLGEAGRRHVRENLTTARVVGGIADFYRECMSRWPRQATSGPVRRGLGKQRQPAA